MPELVNRALLTLTDGLEIVGASALVLGFVIATLRFVWQIASVGVAGALASYRQALGRVVLIGLEVLVAATIIKTITIEPSLQGFALLTIMIVIRTILSWTTVLEMTGRWPWQKKPAAESA